ncbi:MAG: oligosaccharide flippase family protein [Cyclobacteriaceae bacterium]
MKDNFRSLLGNLVASTLGIISFVLVAKKTEVAVFGAFALFMSVAGIFDLLKTGLIRQGLVREISTTSSQETHKKVFKNSLLLNHLILMIFVLPLPFGWAYEGSNNAILVLRWYPLLAASQSMHHIGSWISHAKQDFFRMNLFRIVANSIITLCLLITDSLAFENLMAIIISGNLIASLLAISTMKELRHTPTYFPILSNHLLQFGKKNVLTLLGGNLLKNTDIIILGLYFSNHEVAQFAVPLKLLEMVDIPLRSFVSTAYPKLSRSFTNGSITDYKLIISDCFKKSYLIALPIAVACMIAPNLIFTAVSGKLITTDSIFIMRLISIAMILQPLDKLIGVSLDAQNKPGKNAYKVWIMVGINIIGDLIVVFYALPYSYMVIVTIINQLGGLYFIWKSNPIPKTMELAS